MFAAVLEDGPAILSPEAFAQGHQDLQDLLICVLCLHWSRGVPASLVPCQAQRVLLLWRPEHRRALGRGRTVEVGFGRLEGGEARDWDASSRRGARRGRLWRPLFRTSGKSAVRGDTEPLPPVPHQLRSTAGWCFKDKQQMFQLSAGTPEP